mgnify:CR=1 FL=1
MKLLRLTLLTSVIVSLASCGSNELSFETIDTSVKSYANATKKMSIAERSDFNRDFLIVAELNETPAEELSMEAWSRAQNDYETLSDEMTADALDSGYGRSIMETSSALNGMSVSDVVKRAAQIEKDVLKSTKKQLEEKQFSKKNRMVLVEVLNQQCQGLSLTGSVKENIKKRHYPPTVFSRKWQLQLLTAPNIDKRFNTNPDIAESGQDIPWLKSRYEEIFHIIKVLNTK